jgi:hypothetical protein
MEGSVSCKITEDLIDCMWKAVPGVSGLYIYPVEGYVRCMGTKNLIYFIWKAVPSVREINM